MKKRTKVERISIPVADAAENWQRCRQEDLPRAFYAYDDEEKQGERVVSYRLKKGDVKKLTKQASNGGSFQFIVHLGLYPGDMGGRITNDPAFALYLQVLNEDNKWQENCLELVWAENTRFSASDENSNSKANAIPAASAYLFVHSWLEMEESELDRPFTAATRVMGKRVKAYIFSAAESLSILQDLKNSSKGQLLIHLGSGLAVWDHPFSFRPVMEVPGAVSMCDPLPPVPRNATGLTNDDGDSFYDFGRPHPPGNP